MAGWGGEFRSLPRNCPAYTVATSASPSAGGTTSGGGTFKSGASITVLALANAGYSFVNWTEGGVEVSASASYSFTASADRTLVANFAPVSTTTRIRLLYMVSPVHGGHKTIGVVLLSAPTPAGGATVLLASSDPTVLPVPASLFVPARHRVAVFAATAAKVSQPTMVNVTATPGNSQKTAAVKVIPHKGKGSYPGRRNGHAERFSELDCREGHFVQRLRAR